MSDILELTIPASTANLGVGFDSIGMALDKFLFLSVQKSNSANWEYDFLDEASKSLPADETNFIYQVAQQVAQKYNVTLPALHITMRSEIPLARGLGSSASALVGAIYIANYFGNIQLSKYEILQLATEIEGHPDNVAPTIYGGLIAGYYNDITNKTSVAHIDIPDVDIVVTIPFYELRTVESRKALPSHLSHNEAVKSSAISNTMICALAQHNYDLAGELMQQDGFHEPYRQPLIKEFADIKAIAQEFQAYATVISGAGPSILTFSRKEKSGALVRHLNKQFSTCHSELVDINKTGVLERIIYE
ncbi:homoserine kinase [Staphylococcus simiae]|uniref:Homoserine kinase n=1 Tax=Staphylococcus simiae CCM 7213 = CCUG 51256 TaxID=911238 RepID=G5JK16_9STAP|nr:homoserine kinase [Staphylococcus simiae]EHJ07469.1 homoserine kinase [Staphylococcus simiae CCM 7213 = CCUG 51256]PNZ09456.1 homoserine kinase [Staphylococcus simiae]SNV70392.1 Homoserine kinase [Staphylococcus simiae]